MGFLTTLIIKLLWLISSNETSLFYHKKIRQQFISYQLNVIEKVLGDGKQGIFLMLFYHNVHDCILHISRKFHPHFKIHDLPLSALITQCIFFHVLLLWIQLVFSYPISGALKKSIFGCRKFFTHRLVILQVALTIQIYHCFILLYSRAKTAIFLTAWSNFVNFTPSRLWL